MTWEDPYLQHIEEIIAVYGHAVQYVGGDPATKTRPIAYTVGLHVRPYRDYELAVSGLEAEESVGVLNALAMVLVDRRLQPADGLEIDGILQHGLGLRLRAVSRPEELGVIGALYDAIPPVWQAVWPDRENRWPGDNAYGLSDRVQSLL